MAEKYQVHDAPPPYSYNNPDMTTQQGNIIVVGKKDNGVFHNGARFNEFAKPVIHPPPPGCPPNALQQLQMEKGPMEIIVPQTHDNKAFQQ